MIKGIFFTLLISAFCLIGCNENPVTNPTGGGLGGGNGGGGGGNVTFTVSSTTDPQQGTTNFGFLPSTNVTATSVVVSLPAQNFIFTETNPNPAEVFTTAEGFQITDYTGVASGQQWTFQIKGNIGSATGQAYDVTVNYTIP